MNNTDSAIELEVQARVNFKFQQLVEVLINTISSEQYAEILNGRTTREHVLTRVLKMVKKEWAMMTPYNEMADQNRKDARDAAIDSIIALPEIHNMHRLPEFRINKFIRSLVTIIEKSQDWPFTNKPHSLGDIDAKMPPSPFF